MTAVTYTDGTEKIIGATESMTRLWVSPATMDSADTVTVPTVTGASVVVISARELTTGDSVTATVSSYTITLDAAGGGTNTSYAVLYCYVQS